MYGRVIGIVVRKITNYGSTSYEGVAFAIPIDGAKVVLDAIIKDGRLVAAGDMDTVKGDSSLESVFLDLEGGTQEAK
jgi:S1-C subfamily serine protease